MIKKELLSYILIQKSYKESPYESSAQGIIKY